MPLSTAAGKRGRVMRLGTAIELLIDNYRYASDKEWIQDKVAWALYHTWKEADRKTENSSEKPNNCEPHIVGKHADVIIIDEPQTDFCEFKGDMCNDCSMQTDCPWR